MLLGQAVATPHDEEVLFRAKCLDISDMKTYTSRAGTDMKYYVITAAEGHSAVKIRSHVLQARSLIQVGRSYPFTDASILCNWNKCFLFSATYLM